MFHSNRIQSIHTALECTSNTIQIVLEMICHLKPFKQELLLKMNIYFSLNIYTYLIVKQFKWKLEQRV